MPFLKSLWKSRQPQARPGLNPIQAFSYQYAWQLLNKMHQQVPFPATQRACDFGSGLGGATLATQDFLKIPVANMTLLEEEPSQATRLQVLFPGASIISGNGLTQLSTTGTLYDLISAYMLGPDYYNEGFSASFIHHSLKRLTPDGRLLISSDTGTMQVIQNILETQTAIFTYWLIQPNLPATVLIQYTPFINSNPPHLPASTLYTASIPNSQGEPEQEEYSLGTPFERAYLAATIQTFKQESLHHPAIPYLESLLQEATSAHP